MNYTAVIYGKDEKVLRKIFKICQEGELKIVGTAKTWEELLHLYELYFPDLVLVSTTSDFSSDIVVAEKITCNNIITKVIYITESCDGYKKAYESFCYDCIEKRSLKARLPKTLSRVKKEIDLIKRKDRRKKVVIKVNKKEILTKVKDIVYIKKNRRKIQIILKNESYKSYDTLKSWSQRLAKNPSFFRCHQSYLVNLSEVVLYDKEENHLEMSTGRIIPVSRRNSVILSAKLQKVALLT